MSDDTSPTPKSHKPNVPLDVVCQRFMISEAAARSMLGDEVRYAMDVRKLASSGAWCGQSWMVTPKGVAMLEHKAGQR